MHQFISSQDMVHIKCKSFSVKFCELSTSSSMFDNLFPARNNDVLRPYVKVVAFNGFVYASWTGKVSWINFNQVFVEELPEVQLKVVSRRMVSFEGVETWMIVLDTAEHEAFGHLLPKDFSWLKDLSIIRSVLIRHVTSCCFKLARTVRLKANALARTRHTIRVSPRTTPPSISPAHSQSPFRTLSLLLVLRSSYFQWTFTCLFHQHSTHPPFTLESAKATTTSVANDDTASVYKGIYLRAGVLVSIKKLDYSNRLATRTITSTIVRLLRFRCCVL
ncbi:hypothetical protein Tco_1274434 [Tanacetum coccineum]